jgi:hypothetical protein
VSNDQATPQAIPNELHRVVLAWPETNEDDSTDGWQLASIAKAEGRSVELHVTDREGFVAGPTAYFLALPGDCIPDPRGFAVPLYCQIMPDGLVIDGNLEEQHQDAQLQHAEEQALQLPE